MGLVSRVHSRAIAHRWSAERVLDILRHHPAAYNPAIIGRVTDAHPRSVEVQSPMGGGRILDLLSGEQMPRIC